MLFINIKEKTIDRQNNIKKSQKYYIELNQTEKCPFFVIPFSRTDKTNQWYEQSHH